MMSACPACLAVSSMRWSSTQSALPSRTSARAHAMLSLAAGAVPLRRLRALHHAADGGSPGPSVVESWIAGDPELQVSAEPSAVAAGGRVNVRLTTGRHIAWPGSGATLLDRWDGQRWLPAAGSGPEINHPSAAPATRPVPAGTTGPLAVVDTPALPPGDYRVSARVGLRDAEGSVGVQGFFSVTVGRAGALTSERRDPRRPRRQMHVDTSPSRRLPRGAGRTTRRDRDRRWTRLLSPRS